MKKKNVFAWGVCVGLTAWGCFGSVGCAERIPETEITVYMPDGAPALALAELMHGDTESDGVTYRVVDTSEAITPLLSKLTNEEENKNADFCVLPLTAASMKLGTGEKYVMLGVVTQGNLYLISQDSVTYGKDNLTDLIGKTVLVKNMAEVPGRTLKAALTRGGVAWKEYDGEKVLDKVNLATAADSYEVELLAEPAVSKRLGQNANWKVVGDLQALYGDCGLGQNGYPQAVLVAKKSFVEKKGDWTESFVEKIAKAGAWLYTASAEEIYGAVTGHFEDSGKTPTFTAATLGAETVSRCGVRFAYATDAKNAVESYLTEIGYALPASGFYRETRK